MPSVPGAAGDGRILLRRFHPNRLRPFLPFASGALRRNHPVPRQSAPVHPQTATDETHRPRTRSPSLSKKQSSAPLSSVSHSKKQPLTPPIRSHPFKTAAYSPVRSHSFKNSRSIPYSETFSCFPRIFAIRRQPFFLRSASFRYSHLLPALSYSTKWMNFSTSR